MNDQLSMLPPIAHRDDPESSHEAARRVQESGRQCERAEFARDLVADLPNATAYELRFFHHLDKIDIYELRRALSDARNMGFIERGRVRRCNVTHGCRGCGTWTVSPGKESHE